MKPDAMEDQHAAGATEEVSGDQIGPPSDGHPMRRLMDRLASLTLLALIPMALLRIGLRPVGDPDTFWHIKAGEHLWQTWSFVAPDALSRFSEHPWVLHEWLPELAFFGASSAGGLPAVAWLNCAAIGVLFAVLYLLCRQWVPLMSGAILATAGVFGASASLSPRPQLVTFILLALVTTAWIRTAEDLRPRWWLIPLTWVWACSHGLWFAGVIAGCAAVAGLALDRRLTGRQGLTLALLPIGCAVAGMLTPVGPNLLVAALRIGDATSLVTEWAPPTITSPNVALTLSLALALILLWSRRTRRVSWAHLALLTVAVGWTLLYSRTVALGAVMLPPLLATAWPILEASSSASRRAERVTLWGSVAASLVVAALVLPSLAKAPGMPHDLDKELDKLAPGTVVFDDYSVGGWMLWRHPKLAPVIDPRIEVYDASYVNAYRAAMAVAPGWEATVTSTGADHALLRAGSPLAWALADYAGWVTVATADGYALLREPR
jgi:hypothetical protein